MIALPKRPIAKRRNVENEDIRNPAVAAIKCDTGLLGGNQRYEGEKAAQRDVAPVLAAWRGKCGHSISAAIWYLPQGFGRTERPVARIGWIECKTKGRGKAAADAHQRNWAEAMRCQGHFVAEGVTSVERGGGRG